MEDLEMRIDQVSYYCATPKSADLLKEDIKIPDDRWIKDMVTATSRVALNGIIKHDINVAELQFAYDLGMEIEIIRYISGPHWHQDNKNYNSSLPFLSHIGAHLDDGENFPDMRHWQLVQETVTASHTSKFLTDPVSAGYGRRYHYRVYQIGPGNYFKFIRRLHFVKQQEPKWAL
jgi:hypothetical protein